MMSTISKAKPNIERLQALSREMDQLIAEGRWDYANYRRILQEAKEASGGNGDFLSFLIVEAEPEWLEGDLAITP